MATDLRRTVGRLQSIVDRNPEPDAAVREQITQSQQMLDLLIDGLDDTAVDPNVRERIRSTRDVARKAAERAAIVAETEAAVLKRVKPQADDDGDDLSEKDKLLAMGRAFEDDVVEEIKSYDLDPADFDWKEATDILVKDGVPATRKWFRAKIKEALAEADTEERRQARKTLAKPSPKPAGAAKSGVEVISDPSASLEARIAALRGMGVLK